MMTTTTSITRMISLIMLLAIYEADGYKCYYFGGGDDGAMRTNKTTVDY